MENLHKVKIRHGIKSQIGLYDTDTEMLYATFYITHHSETY